MHPQSLGTRRCKGLQKPTACPEYAAVYSDKTEEEMTNTQKEKQKALNTNKRPLREKEQATRNAEMKRYSKPCGISSQKKTDLLKLCSKNLIPNRYHQFYKELPTSSTKKDD